MKFPSLFTPHRDLLPEGRAAGPMPWVIAIMIFLTVLAGAAGLGLASAARALGDQISGRLTIQIIDADAETREAEARAAVAAARQVPGVRRVARVPDSEIARLLAPWFGPGELDLPVPALIDVDVADAAAIAPLTRRVEAAAPSARVDAQSRWLGSLRALIDTLRWLAAAVVILMAVATGACVVLAARAALNTHRATIDVLHLLGATDLQIARLFQRRIALDALFGGGVGFAGGVLMILLLGQQARSIGSELIGAGSLAPGGWVALAAIPLGGALLATAAARLTVERAMRQSL